MTCYRGAGGSSDDGSRDVDGRGRPLSFPARVVRGEAVSCYVNAHQLWDSRLQLVITDCRFTTAHSANRTTRTYHFITDKCVVVDDSHFTNFNNFYSFFCVFGLNPGFVIRSNLTGSGFSVIRMSTRH